MGGRLAVSCGNWRFDVLYEQPSDDHHEQYPLEQHQ